MLLKRLANILKTKNKQMQSHLNVACCLLVLAKQLATSVPAPNIFGIRDLFCYWEGISLVLACGCTKDEIMD